MRKNPEPKSKELQLIREQIVVSPMTYTVPAESEAFRNELAVRALEIKSITSGSQNLEAAEIVGDIRKHIKDVSAVRMMLSKPLDEAKARLIDIERDHVAPLIAEQERLQKLGTNWTEQEKRRMADEARKRAEEIAALAKAKREADEKLEAERSAAELQRVEMEQKAALAASKIKNEAKRQAFEAEQARLKADRDAAALVAEQKAKEAAEQAALEHRSRILAPEAVAEKTHGQSSRRYLKFKVTDAKAVYAVRPELCNVEVKASAVTAVVFAKNDATDYAPDKTTVPGLELWWEERLTYKSK